MTTHQEILKLCDEELDYSQKAIRGIQTTLDTYFFLKTDDTGIFMRKEIEKYKLHYFYYLKLKQLNFSEDYVDIDMGILKILTLTVQKLIKCQSELIELFDERMFKTEADVKLSSLKKSLQDYNNQFSFLTSVKTFSDKNALSSGSST